MKFHKIKSFAKVNLTLKILNKYSNGYHKIESLISKINLADEILIKEIQGSKNRISFSGKFSSNISNTNTISKLLKILNNQNYIQNKKFEIPVCCEKEFSLDIKRLEEKLKMKEAKIYESFFEKEFFCYMTGFIAGMPFLGDLDENLRAKRLDTPRVKVPKGSIGLTEQFANIYTFESPGGWNIIGNTPLNIFDSTKEKEPNLINPGDLVTFKRISKEKYQNYHE